ncbi:MAG: hypothetical protein COT14_03635 [Candidatus Diapherotrites archaeon CG08_land_8_20_14_0_20_30_16]|nr:MAG: hypothetical protein COT14_03635 [Candidatus Diapherotrites archaeon CG08_land_8_20_14_0_20_30_16]
MIHLWQAYTPVFGMTFLLSSVLIDFDHYLLILYATKFRVWDPRKAYNYFKSRNGKLHLHIDALFIFHTIEFLVVLLLIYWFTKWTFVLAVVFGWIYHLFFDMLEVTYFKIRHNRRHKYKPLSLIWYLVK